MAGPTPPWSLVIVEGCWWVLNCQKLIKSSCVDMPGRTFSEFITLFWVSSPSAPALLALKRGWGGTGICVLRHNLWPEVQNHITYGLEFHFFFSLGDFSSSLWLGEYIYCFFLGEMKCSLWISGWICATPSAADLPCHTRHMAVWRACVTPGHVAGLKLMYPICWSIAGKRRFVLIQDTRAFQYFPHSPGLPKYYSSLYPSFFNFPKVFDLTITSSPFNMIYLLSNPVNS